MQTGYSEKDLLGDGLAAAKMATNNYNTFSNECVHTEVREVALKLLKEEHNIQQDVFSMMHEKGYYPTPMADENKVSKAKQKFSQGVKAI